MTISPSDTKYLVYWYDALEQPLGLGLRISDRATVIGRLNAARRAAADPQLDALMIRAAPDDPQNTIWIVRRAA